MSCFYVFISYNGLSSQCAFESSHMLILSQCFGTEFCGQCFYFEQMLRNINTHGERCSSTCAPNPALSLSLMENRVTKQRMPTLKTTNHTVLLSKCDDPAAHGFMLGWIYDKTSFPFPSCGKLMNHHHNFYHYNLQHFYCLVNM